MYQKYLILVLFISLFGAYNCDKCRRKGSKTSITTVSGTFAPRKVCAGELIFDENFEKLDFKKWKHELTLGGGGNWEFQWYVNNRSNSFVKDGKLFIKPTLTMDVLGAKLLFNHTLAVDYCTDPRFYGCQRVGTPGHILNPVRSAKLTTQDKFAFKYGKVKIRAKMPTGDWLQPAIWMLPIDYAYGKWPTSGTIVLAQCRANPVYFNQDNETIGVEQIEANLHWGPDVTHDGYEEYGKFLKNSPRGHGWDKEFHDYEMIWTQEFIKFYLDGELFGHLQPNKTFWELGGFNSEEKDNPYAYATKMAPFDEEFYFIINLSVGGIFYWKDYLTNTDKPWSNKAISSATDFWEEKDSWLKSWKLKEGDSAALQIEYIKVWAL